MGVTFGSESLSGGADAAEASADSVWTSGNLEMLTLKHISTTKCVLPNMFARSVFVEKNKLLTIVHVISGKLFHGPENTKMFILCAYFNGTFLGGPMAAIHMKQHTVRVRVKLSTPSLASIYCQKVHARLYNFQLLHYIQEKHLPTKI